MPPIKIQGIKTKLVPFIQDGFKWSGDGKWVEPFMGSGVVVFNLRPDTALLADNNPHIIRFYKDIQYKLIDNTTVSEWLTEQGVLLSQKGEDYYYEVRKRFNNTPNSLDFLFLNRACFNGLMRFNSKGGFNVPFCRKNERFSKAYVTKISNQVKWVSEVITNSDYTFKCQDYKETLSEATVWDFTYIDPPYAGRNADYYHKWDDSDADELAGILKNIECGFALSTWLENKYRKNEWVNKHFSDYPTSLYSHFYHIGSSEKLRNEMTEILIVQKGFKRADG